MIRPEIDGHTHRSEQVAKFYAGDSESKLATAIKDFAAFVA